MTTGAQAAAYAKQFLGTPTSINKCVYGIVYVVLNPLGVPAPQTEYIPTFLSSPLVKQIDKPVPGCVARWPRSRGYGHVSMITDVLGDGSQVVEQSWGTSTGKVRAFTYDTSFFESFWLPAYSESGTTANLASSVTGQQTGFVSSAGKVAATLNDPDFWVRVGIGALGAALMLLALIKLLGGPSGIVSKVGKVAETAALVVPK